MTGKSYLYTQHLEAENSRLKLAIFIACTILAAVFLLVWLWP